ncbi:MAG: molybdopterin molybdotransferase MoeA, partial [Chloroflexia bacterium]|nr:molybdopterin molybdotransferase MoeA [Chloroflexia bacterium]
MELGPAELGLVAGGGFVPVPVSARPRVSVVSTGDELVEPGEPVRPGQIRDSNRFSLVAALAAVGAEVVWSGKAPDSASALRSLLVARLAESEVVVTSGGVSMGDLDLIKPLLGDLATVHFRRVFMKPGKPLNFATTDSGALIFGLPGNPVSALVSFETFIRPALRTMMGCRSIDRPRVPVTLAQGTPPSDRIEMQRATVRVDRDGRLVATTTGSQASSRLASFLGANALLVIPPRATPYEPGERVVAVLLAPPLAAE